MDENIVIHADLIYIIYWFISRGLHAIINFKKYVFTFFFLHSFEIEFKFQNLFAKHSFTFCFTIYFPFFLNIHMTIIRYFLCGFCEMQMYNLFICQRILFCWYVNIQNHVNINNYDNVQCILKLYIYNNIKMYDNI